MMARPELQVGDYVCIGSVSHYGQIVEVNVAHGRSYVRWRNGSAIWYADEILRRVSPLILLAHMAEDE